jgi:hypothetical protein
VPLRGSWLRRWLPHRHQVEAEPIKDGPAAPRPLSKWRAGRLGAAWIDVTGGVDEANAPLLWESSIGLGPPRAWSCSTCAGRCCSIARVAERFARLPVSPGSKATRSSWCSVRITPTSRPPWPARERSGLPPRDGRAVRSKPSCSSPRRRSGGERGVSLATGLGRAARSRSRAELAVSASAGVAAGLLLGRTIGSDQASSLGWRAGRSRDPTRRAGSPLSSTPPTTGGIPTNVIWAICDWISRSRGFARSRSRRAEAASG